MGRWSKEKRMQMERQKIKDVSGDEDTVIPKLKEGEVADYWVEITRVSNGYITKNRYGEFKVYNSDIHESAMAYVIAQVLRDLETGDIMEIQLTQKLIKKGLAPNKRAGE